MYKSLGYGRLRFTVKLCEFRFIKTVMHSERTRLSCIPVHCREFPVNNISLANHIFISLSLNVQFQYLF